jgi:translation initiation factor 6 (eIF-6)
VVTTRTNATGYLCSKTKYSGILLSKYIRNELLIKRQKTILEIAHIRTVNRALENDILTQLNNVTAYVNHLESQLKPLQQQNTQIMGESNEMRIAAMQTQGNLELQIS